LGVVLAKGSPGLKAVSQEMSILLKHLGENIKRARMRRGMKQADLAERLSVSRPTLRKLECGDPTVSVAVLVQVLDVFGLADQLAHIADPDMDALGKALEQTSLQRTRVDSPRRKDDLDF